MNYRQRLVRTIPTLFLLAGAVCAQEPPPVPPAPPAAAPAPAEPAPPQPPVQPAGQLDSALQQKVENEVDRAIDRVSNTFTFLVGLSILASLGVAIVVLRSRKSIARQTAREVRQQLEDDLRSGQLNLLAAAPESVGGAIAPAAPEEAELKEVVSMALAAQNVLSEARATIEQSLQFQNRLEGQLHELVTFKLQEGDKLLAAGNHREALETYDKALQIREGSAEAWQRRGEALEKLEDTDLAVQAYRHATDLNPQNLTSWVNLGSLLSRADRNEEAVVAFERACQLAPHDSATWNSASVPLMKLGRRDEAERALKKAAELKPDSAENCYGMARLHALQGDVENAIEYLTQAIALDPNNKQRAKTDPDFAAIVENEWFYNLVSV